MLKRTAALFLCIMTLLSAVIISAPNCFAAADSVSDLKSLAQKFPHGKYWNHIGSPYNNPDGYTSTPCTRHGSICNFREGSCDCNSFLNAIQCRGYAYKLANEITDSDPREWGKSYTLSASSLRVGDIIRYLNDGHSIVVVAVKGNTISFTGANWGGNCLIKWGTMSLSSLRGFTYVLHQKGNNRKNTDLYFYNNLPERVTVEAEKSEAATAAEKWKMVGDASLNIRKSPSTSSNVTGSIPVGKTYYVTEKKSSDGYLWGKVTYGSKTGWAALDYSKYISGSYEAPEVIPFEADSENSKVKIKWNKLSGATKYVAYLYDSEGTRVAKKSTSKNYCTFTIEEAGYYTVKVTAKNSKISSWKQSGEEYGFVFAKEHGKADCKYAPNAPTKLKVAERTESTCTLSWKKMKNASCYIVYKYNTQTKAYEFFKATDETTVTVDCNEISRFRVTSVRLRKGISHESERSKLVYAIPEPAAVTFSALSENGKVFLSWEKADNASGYIVYRKSKGEFKEIYRASADKTEYTVKNLEKGEKESFRICAYIKKGGETVIGKAAGTLTVTVD